ncbi:MAG TPA: hypothetical protein VK469_02735 [Candidatus Kapabacteria bacterium]|nr:hypothetical protein [Candidatus Kapabacteria bacterium]
MSFKTILIIIIIIAIIGFFWFFYTPGALKKAEDKYNVEKTGLLSKTEALEKEIAIINENKIKIEGELKLEKVKTAQLDKKLNETSASLAAIKDRINKMPDSDVTKNTKVILTQNIQENPFDGKTQLADADLIQKNDKVIWAFFPMKVNLRILEEYKNFKTKFPSLEEKCTSLEKQSNYYNDLYQAEQNISKDRKEQYENEKTLRLKSEDLYSTCKKQIKAGKTKALLIGGGVGAGLVLLLMLLK